jgi:hypothetical protein
VTRGDHDAPHDLRGLRIDADCADKSVVLVCTQDRPNDKMISAIRELADG